MPKICCPIVGSHFHPPAKALLSALPAGLALELAPEPENPYDPEGMLVQVPLASFQSLAPSVASHLDGALLQQAATLDQVVSTAPARLGHIAATGGKPLLKLAQDPANPALSGTREAHAGYDAGAMASLGFLPSGAPVVWLEWEG